MEIFQSVGQELLMMHRLINFVRELRIPCSACFSRQIRAGSFLGVVEFSGCAVLLGTPIVHAFGCKIYDQDLEFCVAE